jgi:predicted MPP superfamily phosphohydrolase
MEAISGIQGTSPGERFTFAHLSDIHFAGYRDGAVFDLDSNIRQELIYDLRTLVEKAGPIDAILIGGDIAGRGTVAEYEKATEWIDGLCDEFDVPLEMVFCVPGNHDVYRPAIEGDTLFRTAQEVLLNCSLEEFGVRLEELFTDERHPGLLLSGLDNYNLFAARYSGAIKPDDHRWSWTSQFGDLKIHIVGLSSAILCGPGDAPTADQSRLAIGPQAQVKRFDDDTVTILLSHHPPAWLRDYDIHATFIERAHLQLYGHEHSFAMAPSGGGYRIDAGAVQPPRRVDHWQPSYNVISVYRDSNDSARRILDLYARRLGDDHIFTTVEEGEDLKRESIAVGVSPATAGAPPEPVAPSPAPDPIEERYVARRLFEVSRDTRTRIGRELGLLNETDQGVSEGVRWRRALEQARAEGRLAELKEKVDG